MHIYSQFESRISSKHVNKVYLGIAKINNKYVSKIRNAEITISFLFLGTSPLGYRWFHPSLADEVCEEVVRGAPRPRAGRW